MERSTKRYDKQNVFIEAYEGAAFLKCIKLSVCSRYRDAGELRARLIKKKEGRGVLAAQPCHQLRNSGSHKAIG